MAGWVDGWIWKVPRYAFTFLKDYLPSVSSVSLIKEYIKTPIWCLQTKSNSHNKGKACRAKKCA